METSLVNPAPRIAVSHAGEGPLVLFLHGIGGKRSNWNAQMEALSGAGFKAAAWDARGYGDSDDFEGPLNFRDHLMGDVLRVAEHFGAKKFHLVGLAMGGRIARNVAIYYPDRVHTLTIVNANPGFNAMSADAVRRFITERFTRTPDSIRQFLGSCPRPGAYEELAASIGAIRDASYRKMLEAAVAQDRDPPIENIRAPTLILYGEEDTIYEPELARAAVSRIPDAELTMVQRAGHLANLEQPEAFNGILLEFLTRNRPH